MSDQIVNQIDQLRIEEDTQRHEISEIQNTCRYFTSAYIKELLIDICTEYKKAIDSKDKAQNNQLIESKIERFMNIYRKLKECTQEILNTCIASTKRVSEEIQKIGQEVNEEIAFQKYSRYQTQLYNIFVESNPLLDYVNLFVSCVASGKEHKMDQSLDKFCQDTLELLNSFEKLYTVEQEIIDTGLSIESKEQSLSRLIAGDHMEILIWSISKISHSMIKNEPEEDEVDKVTRDLLNAKLFSGGIQNRFLSTFSSSVCQSIKSLASIIGNNELEKFLAGPDKTEEDDIINAIINEGKHPGVDKFINLLQWNLMKTKPFVKVGGKEGMTLSRFALAVTLSLNQNDPDCSRENIMMIIDTVEMTSQELDDNLNEDQQNKALTEELKTTTELKPFLDRWENSCKMRIWLQEKRRDIANSMQKKFEIETNKKSHSNILKNLFSKSKIKIKQEDSKQVNVDDFEDDMRTLPEIRKTNEETLRLEQQEVEEIVSKVRQKAELLIKLATPKAWNDSDSSDSLIRHISHFEDSKENKDNTLIDKIKRIKTIQTSKVTVTTYENVSNKYVFTSCMSSVLA